MDINTEFVVLATMLGALLSAGVVLLVHVYPSPHRGPKVVLIVIGFLVLATAAVLGFAFNASHDGAAKQQSQSGRTFDTATSTAVAAPTFTATPSLTPTTISSPTPAPDLTDTPIPLTPTPSVAPTLGSGHDFVDLGNCNGNSDAPPGSCAGEQGFVFVGWGKAHGRWDDMPFTTPRGDQTVRDMILDGDNSITFSNLPNGDYVLTAEVGDGICDDSFKIIVGGDVLYTYHASDSPAQLFGPAGGGPHTVSIPASYIHDHLLTVTFRNIADPNAADRGGGCGLAGVFNVQLDLQ